MNFARQRFQEGEHGLRDKICEALINRLQQGETRTSFHQADQGAVMRFPHQGVYFPISQAFPSLDKRWTLLDADPIGYFPAVISLPVALAALLLAAQMSMQLSTRTFICQNILINPLVADPDALFLLQPS